MYFYKKIMGIIILDSSLHINTSNSKSDDYMKAEMMKCLIDMIVAVSKPVNESFDKNQ